MFKRIFDYSYVYTIQITNINYDLVTIFMVMIGRLSGLVINVIANNWCFFTNLYFNLTHAYHATLLL